MLDLNALYIKYAEQFLIDFQNAIKENGQVASGKTLKSLEKNILANGFNIKGDKQVYYLEYGRGKTGANASKGEKTLYQIIEQWSKDKGLNLDKKGIGAITYSIHKKGTYLFKNKKTFGTGISNPISRVVTKEKIDNMINDMGVMLAQNVQSDIIKDFKL